MIRSVLLGSLLLLTTYSHGQSFKNIEIDNEITEVQPMTGIVFWSDNSRIETNAVTLEYSYMDFSKIVVAEDVYDWTEVEKRLDQMATRNHQAIFRFRFSYPGRSTTVPQYIKDLPDYNETEGISEGKTTWFPDWQHDELKDMTLKFYTEYAKRYDTDPRLAFVQVGFGLWAEYHIYSGPFKLGETFPSKEFQKQFFDHLDEVFKETYWSISIDAASDIYSPFLEDEEYKNLDFGLFDDSFMHAGHGGYNTNSWNFFDRERYKIAPAGGEFSYYSTYDQTNVLNPDEGAHGIPFEIFAQDFHITYMIGNDQGRYQPMERIKEASMRSGYKFKLVSVQSAADTSIVEVTNLGVAPIYIDAYITANGVRGKETLKLLAPNEVRIVHIGEGGENPVITIESDQILDNEEIQYFGTVNNYEPYSQVTTSTTDLTAQLHNTFKIYPTLVHDQNINIDYKGNTTYSISIYNSSGSKLLQKEIDNSTTIQVNDKYKSGIYFLALQEKGGQIFVQKIFVN